MTVTTSESAIAPLKLGELKMGAADLSKSTLIVCEDGNYNQFYAEEVKVCWYVAMGDPEQTRYLCEEDLPEFKKDYPHIPVLKLAKPVLVIEFPGKQ